VTDTSNLTPDEKARYAYLEDQWAKGNLGTVEETKEFCDLMVKMGELVDNGDGTYSLPGGGK
jgi:hypothetical protein